MVESVQPCRTPCVMGCVSDCAFCVWVDCLRFLRYDSKNFTVVGVKLKSVSSFCRSFLCDIVSYALDRST